MKKQAIVCYLSNHRSPTSTSISTCINSMMEWQFVACYMYIIHVYSSSWPKHVQSHNSPCIHIVHVQFCTNMQYTWTDVFPSQSMQMLHKLLLRRMPGQWNHFSCSQDLGRTCITHRQHPSSTSASSYHHDEVMEHLTFRVYRHRWGSSLPRLYHYPWDQMQGVKRHAWFANPLKNIHTCRTQCIGN